MSSSHYKYNSINVLTSRAMPSTGRLSTDCISSTVSKIVAIVYTLWTGAAGAPSFFPANLTNKSVKPPTKAFTGPLVCLKSDTGFLEELLESVVFENLASSFSCCRCERRNVTQLLVAREERFPNVRAAVEHVFDEAARWQGLVPWWVWKPVVIEARLEMLTSALVSFMNLSIEQKVGTVVIVGLELLYDTQEMYYYLSIKPD